MLETIGNNVITSMNTSKRILDVVQRLDVKIDRLEKKVDAIDMRTRLIATLGAIDVSKYEVSDLYKDRIYLASKKVARFNIQQDNAACVGQGGYLLEIDDENERRFTWAFAQKIGNAPHFALGGNDIDREGRFVYYHSKKPVPSQVTWLPGRPNNAGGNEDCMAFWMSRGGLNDIVCSDNVKYLCEIPLRS